MVKVGISGRSQFGKTVMFGAFISLGQVQIGKCKKASVTSRDTRNPPANSHCKTIEIGSGVPLK